MIATAVENEENRPRCVMHQALQKLDKDRTVDSALGHHETQVAPRADGRDHIHRTPLPRAPHHRRLALNPPRRSRMTIRSHPGFVAKVDLRPDFPSLSAKPRVLLLQPPPHSFRVLLEGPEQRSLACQRPLFRALEQDPKRVRRWLEQEYPRLRRQAREVGAEIYFGDEAGVRSDSHAGTTWGIKGQTPVVRSTGQRSSVNMISAISARGNLRFMVAKGRVNGAVFVEFLKRLMHNAARPIFLILDGGSYHSSRRVKDYVASLDGKLQLFFLPPYSPELNPDEHVWNYLKRHGVAKAGLRSGKELKQYVRARLRSLQRLPWTIRMFFLTPDTQYAIA